MLVLFSFYDKTIRGGDLERSYRTTNNIESLLATTEIEQGLSSLVYSGLLKVKEGKN
jgi:hypothetical protein